VGNEILSPMASLSNSFYYIKTVTIVTCQSCVNDVVYFVIETEYSIQYIKSIYKMRRKKNKKVHENTKKNYINGDE